MGNLPAATLLKESDSPSLSSQQLPVIPLQEGASLWGLSLIHGKFDWFDLVQVLHR